MPEWLSPDALVALLTLTALEIVLGIDNIVFMVILTGRLPAARQSAARRIGLVAALGMRVGLLFLLSWIMGLTEPLFAVFGRQISGRALILLGGGLFLLAKSTWEIYDKLEAAHEDEARRGSAGRFLWVIVQIMFIDIVFSLDSVITAVGMARHIPIMVAAMVIAMLVMMVSVNGVARFIEAHPSLKILALSFLLLIGVLLVAEGLGQHISRGYIYFAMAFSFAVELLNMRFRRKREPVTLHHRFEQVEEKSSG